MRNFSEETKNTIFEYNSTFPHFTPCSSSWVDYFRPIRPDIMNTLSLIPVLASIGVALAQPFTVDTPELQLGVTEARTREDVNYTGFVFDFDKARASDMTPNGMLQPNQVNSNPFLSTLPGDGNGQTLVTLGPCTGNTPHTHPRGSEISFVLYGSMQFGMVEENSAKNTLIFRNITQNETIHVPQGVLHFSHNPTCEPAAFLANFATKDPGTQTMWASMMQVPTNILHSATGIPEVTIQLLKTYPLVTAPGTGGEECLARCNLTFAQANHLYTNPSSVTSISPSAAPALG